MSTLEQIQGSVEDALCALASMQRNGMLPPVLQPLLALAPPAGLEPIVQLQMAADADGYGRRTWDARYGRAVLTFEPRQGDEDIATDPEDVFADLVAVLGEAESNPQLSFVALKFLRDRLLPQTARTWARSPQSCQRAIGDAIESGILWTSKKANPRNPEFPVTAVHLNHEHPLVRAALQRRGNGAAATTPTDDDDFRENVAGL